MCIRDSCIPVPSPPDSLDNICEDLETMPQTCGSDDGSGSDIYDSKNSNDPKLFTQSESNDLVTDLDLPKDSAEVLGSTLKETNLLAPVTSFQWF